MINNRIRGRRVELALEKYLRKIYPDIIAPSRGCKFNQPGPDLVCSELLFEVKEVSTPSKFLQSVCACLSDHPVLYFEQPYPAICSLLGWPPALSTDKAVLYKKPPTAQVTRFLLQAQSHELADPLHRDCVTLVHLHGTPIELTIMFFKVEKKGEKNV